jgi:Domain of unknown function (DUF4185)
MTARRDDGPVIDALATKVCDLTGPGLTDRFGIGGTDLGVTTTAPDGRLVSVFGDTFRRAGVGGLRGWRSPVALFADPGSVATGLRWTGSSGPGELARQVVRYLHQFPQRWNRRWHRVTTTLPTDVITVGDAMYLHVMVCRELGRVHWTELHRSDDNGVTWRPTGTRWPPGLHDGLFQMVTWERGGDGYVYAFSTGFQRDKGLILQRVPEDRLTDTSAWETWGFTEGPLAGPSIDTEDDGWGWGRPPTVALTGAFGELCLRRVEDRWMLVAFDAGNYRMDVRALDSPTADLYRAPCATVLQGVNWEDEDHSAGKVAQLYGGYVIPGSTWADLHLVVSQWNTRTNWPYRAMQFRSAIPQLHDR